jgi:hypothetical protein
MSVDTFTTPRKDTLFSSTTPRPETPNMDELSVTAASDENLLFNFGILHISCRSHEDTLNLTQGLKHSEFHRLCTSMPHDFSIYMRINSDDDAKIALKLIHELNNNPELGKHLSSPPTPTATNEPFPIKFTDMG